MGWRPWMAAGAAALLIVLGWFARDMLSATGAEAAVVAATEERRQPPSNGSPATPPAAPRRARRRIPPAALRWSRPRPPRGAVVGRVVDRRHRPLAGVAVSAADRYTQSDSKGHFSLQGLPERREHTIVLRRRGYCSVSIGPKELAPEVGVDLGTIVLVRGSSLRGVVRAAGDPPRPVAGARVAVGHAAFSLLRHPRGESRAVPVAAAVTDAAGRFAFPPELPPDVELVVTAAGFATARHTVLRIDRRRPDQPPEVITLAPAATLRGIVVHHDGSPAAAARVRAVRLQPEPSSFAEATTDGAGRFTLSDLAAGDHQLLVRVANGQRFLDLGHASTGGTARLTLPPLSTLRGRVTTVDDVPAPRFWLSLLDRRLSHPTETGLRWEIRSPTGRFDLPDLAPGAYTLEAAAPGHAPTRVDVELVPGRVQQGISIRLGPGVELSGTVHDIDGNPVPGAEVGIFPNRLRDEEAFRSRGDFELRRLRWPRTTTDAHGRYRLRHILPFVYQVVARHPDFTATIVDDVHLETTASKTLDLQLNAGAYLQGRILDEADAPVAGARVELFGRDLLRRRLARTDPQGRFVFDPLPLGDYTLVATILEVGLDGLPPALAIPRRCAERKLALDDYRLYTVRVRTASRR